MSVVDDVYTHLLTQGVAGGSTGWGLLRRREMDTPVPDACVTVSEDGGTLPELDAASGIGDAAIADVGVLCTVRGAPWDGDATAAKALEVYAALHNVRDAVLGSSGSPVYFRVRALTPEPVFTGFDDKGRPRHTLAFRLSRFVQQ